MKVEKVHKEIRYTLSNENLKAGDKVYPIANGRCLDGGDWIIHDFDFSDFMSGFPNEPHTILNLKYSDYKPYQVRTDCGFSPIECYFKIIKMERHVKKEGKMLVTWEWVEVEIKKNKKELITK